MKILILLQTILLLFAGSYMPAQVSHKWEAHYTAGGEGVYNLAGVKVDNSGNVFISGSMNGSSLTDYVTVKYNNAGTEQWSRIYTGQIEDRVIDMALDNAGNVCVTGLSENLTGTYDIITIKYNTAGDSLWVKRFNGATPTTMDQPVAMCTDLNNNIYVSGYSFGATPVTFVTIKYSPNGDSLWVARFVSGGTNIPLDIATDAGGNVYVLCRGARVLKYDANGSLIWSRLYTFNAAESNKSLVAGNSGNVYFAATKSTSTFDDFAVVKLNSNGDTVWTRVRNGFGGSSSTHDESRALCLDNSGNVFLAGEIYELGAYNFSTLKYDSNGNFIWERNYFSPQNGDGANDALCDSSGNVYVTGGSNDYTTIKYDANGNTLWMINYNGAANSGDNATAMTIDNSGSIYVAGRSRISLNPSVYEFATVKYVQAKKLNKTALIQGFYDSSANSMIADTARVYLRSIVPPYPVEDSSKAVLSLSGNANYYFYSIQNGIPYYIVLRHRNSIETWSSGGNSFSNDNLNYDFTLNFSQAFGGNLLLKGNKYCIYGGDVNQDESVDLSDIVLIYNDASNFVSGYAATDLNGDNFADISDLAIAFNNSANFVSVIRP